MFGILVLMLGISMVVGVIHLFVKLACWVLIPRSSTDK
jgi:hypothetical protein